MSFYFARGADPNIFEIFPEMIRGEAVMDDTYLYALGYFHPLRTPGGLQKVFDFLLVPNTRTGIEGVVVDPNGSPLPGADVYRMTPGDPPRQAGSRMRPPLMSRRVIGCLA